MKRILSLVLVLALIATLGLSSAFAEEGFADGKFTEPHHITQQRRNQQPLRRVHQAGYA